MAPSLLGLIKITSLGLLFGALAAGATGGGLPVRDPWFDISILLWVFSAITGGMPEPDEKSSFSYIWMFRTFHLLSATGTAYFIHRRKWVEISGPEKEEESECKK